MIMKQLMMYIMKKLWTDEDNRNLIKTQYPEFLKIYDSYAFNINRADVIRYFILNTYGGIYTDLDCIAMKSMTQLLENKSLALGTEPYTNALSYGKQLFLSNALMYSEPNHPFWQVVFEQIKNPGNIGGPVFQTGPGLLTKAYEIYSQTNNDCYVIDYNDFIWSSDTTRNEIEKMWFKDGKRPEDAYVVHANVSVWVTNADEIKK